MTDEQIRIAIAEALGYTHVRIIKDIEGPPDAVIGHHPTKPHSVPNYPADLNAMHEAEKTLTENQWSKYVALLTGRDWICDRVITSDAAQQAIHATARQRATAFLRTLNLWKD